ncbi:hypothetical protein V499_07424 [Pseudogymnoascus sp. VKM F-103]|nr:hypothetical protein V499_07424 [Pseudogymnoascus sp. VKM F-103]
MDFIQTVKRLQPNYPTCSICSLLICTHTHRFFTYHGYLEYLDSTIEPAAVGREGERQIFMTNLAKAEFGFEPEDRVEWCTVCYNDGRLKLHRTLTKEGYARSLREKSGFESVEEAVAKADEVYGDGAGLGSLDDMEAVLGGRTLGYGAALGSLDRMEATLSGHTQGYGIASMSLDGMEASLRALDDMKAALSGGTQGYGAELGGFDNAETTFRRLDDMEATLRDLDDMDAALGSPTKGYGAGLGSLEDIEAALRGRIGDGAESGSLDDTKDTLWVHARGGGGESYGEDDFTGVADEGREYYTKFDRCLEWDIRNEIIRLTRKWEEGLPGVSNNIRDFETFRQDIKDEWIRKADGYPEYPETRRTMPWDDMTWDQLQDLALSPAPKPPPPTTPPTSLRSNTPNGLTDEQYEKARRDYFIRWQVASHLKSPERKNELKVLMEASWIKRVGARGMEDNMPWHIDFFSNPHRPLVQPPHDPLHPPPGGWVSEADQLQFRKEWEDMAFGKDGKLSKDPMQRYTLARLIQAAFITAFGSRGERQVMPWTADLVRPEPVPSGDSAGGDDGMGQSHPLPDTSLETDYATLRSEYAMIFINRIRGEDQEEIERVAGVFREAWVQEVGVRAHDVRMPWDEVLGKQTDREVKQEEVRDVVGGDVKEEGRGRDRGRSRRRRKALLWTRRRGESVCEFQ